MAVIYASVSPADDRAATCTCIRQAGCLVWHIKAYCNNTGCSFPPSAAVNPFMEALRPVSHPPAGTVSYDVRLQPDKNFFVLTGANMAVKSTFIKSVGIAVSSAPGNGAFGQTCPQLLQWLAPAISMWWISFGRKLFFNEVQHQGTIQENDGGKKWHPDC